MNTRTVIALIWIVSTAQVFAAESGNLMHMKADISDQTALQRGATTFVNYCLSCHSATYMRFKRIGSDLGIADEVLKTNLMFGTDKTGDRLDISMRPVDAERFFGVVPPDLSVIARARGADWLYTYFKTFYVDESRPFGVNNLAYKDVSMPHVLWQLQGIQHLYKHEDAVNKHRPTYADLQLVTPGMQTEQEYDQTIRDLVNFLVYLGEPIKLKRSKIGAWVMFYLIIFAVIAYLLKREYWRDIH